MRKALGEIQGPFLMSMIAPIMDHMWLVKPLKRLNMTVRAYFGFATFGSPEPDFLAFGRADIDLLLVVRLALGALPSLRS